MRRGRPDHAQRDRRPSWPVRLLAALTVSQALCCLAALGIATAAGDAAAGRTSQAVLACGFGAAGVLLAVAARRDARCLYLLAAFAAIAAAFGRAAVSDLPDAYISALAPLLRGIYPESFTPGFVWQFALVYPRVRRFTRFDLFARRVAAGAWLVGAALFAINFAAAYGLAVGPLDHLLRNHPGNGFWSLFALAIAPALATILVRSRRAPVSDRRRLARFAWATVSGTAPIVLCGIVRMLWPQFNAWFLTAGPAERGWVDRLVAVSLMATPILGAMSIVLDRPFDVPPLVPAGARRRLAKAAATAVVAAPFAAFVTSVYVLRTLPLTDLFSGARGGWLVLCLASGFVLLRARARLLDAIERRTPGDHHERLAGALDLIRMARGAREICAVLDRELRHGVGNDDGPHPPAVEQRHVRGSEGHRAPGAG